MEIFNIKPDAERKMTPSWNNRRVKMQNGNEQVQQTQVNPETKWELKFTLLYNDRKKLEDFFNARRGGVEKFYWIENKDGKTPIQHTVRFAVDSLDFNEVYGFDDDGLWKALKHTVTVQLQKVW